MRTKFPVLKVGSTFYRNGLLLEVMAIEDGTLTLHDLINNDVIKVGLRAMQNHFRGRPGQMEMVPRDIARKEAEAAQLRRNKGTGYRGRKPLDMRKAGLHDLLLSRCQTRRQLRYQTTFIIEEGFEVVVYRRTPRIDFAMLREDGCMLTPWSALPVGVKYYRKDDPYLRRRPWLSMHVDPRAVRNDELSVEYVDKIITATLKGA